MNIKTNINFIIIFLFSSLSIFSQSSAIPYIELTSPNGGEKWEALTTHSITWQSDNISKVKIEYSYTNGLNWQTITPSVDASLGKYLWTTTNSQVSQVLIKVSDADNPELYNINDMPFSIVKIESPESKELSKTTNSTSTSIKIMPLGDSITWGYGAVDTAYVGYREALYNSLNAAGYNFTFVGSEETGLELIYPSGPAPGDSNYNFYTYGRHHEGHGGWSAYNYPYTCFSLYHSLTTRNGCGVGDFLISNHPDIILLHIGTNDIGQSDPQYYDTPQSLSWQVHLILDKINTFDPNITVFLARIINRNDADSQKTRTTNFNLQLQQMADSLINIYARKIVVVNMEAALTYPDDLSDWGHPNTTGYQKMANKWLSSMQNFYKPTLASPADSSTNQALNVALTWKKPPAVSFLGTLNYQLQISTNTNFSNIVYDNTAADTSRSAPGLKYGTKYYWRVRIADYGWSDTLNFTTLPMAVYAKVYLQGPYNTSTSMMDTTLKKNGLIPTSQQPYNVSPWNYNGNEHVSSIPDSVVDWILVDLRTGTDSASTVARRAVFLKEKGGVVDTNNTPYVNFSGISAGNYYIVVRHRNHLAIMSHDPVSLPNSSGSVYNFTSAQTQAYGTNAMADLNGDGTKFGLWAGDVNGDGTVKYNLSGNDRVLIYAKIGGGDVNATISGYYNEDVNLDGIVKYNLSNNDRALIYGAIGGGDVNATVSTQVP